MNTKGRCYPKYVILQAVYFKLRYTLSYRDVEEIMNRGVIDPMLRFSAGFIDRLDLNSASSSKRKIPKL